MAPAPAPAPASASASAPAPTPAPAPASASALKANAATRNKKITITQSKESEKARSLAKGEESISICNEWVEYGSTGLRIPDVVQYIDNTLVPYLNGYDNYLFQLQFDWGHKSVINLTIEERWRLAYFSLANIISRSKKIFKNLGLQLTQILANLPTRKHTRVKRTINEAIAFFRKNDVNYGMPGVKVYMVLNEIGADDEKSFLAEMANIFEPLGASFTMTKMIARDQSFKALCANHQQAYSERMLASALSYTCSVSKIVLPTILSWVSANETTGYDRTVEFFQKLVSKRLKLTFLDKAVHNELALNHVEMLERVKQTLVIDMGPYYHISFPDKIHVTKAVIDHGDIRSSQLRVLAPVLEMHRVEGTSASENFMLECRDKCIDLDLFQKGDNLYKLLPDAKLTLRYHCTVEQFISFRSSDLKSILQVYRYGASVLKFFTGLGRHVLPQYRPNSDLIELQNAVYQISTGNFLRFEEIPDNNHCSTFFNITSQQMITTLPTRWLSILSNSDIVNERLEQFKLAYGRLFHQKKLKERNLTLVGPSQCGKSTLLDPLNAIIGTENIGRVSQGKNFSWERIVNKKVILLEEFKPQNVCREVLLIVLEGRVINVEVKFEKNVEMKVTQPCVLVSNFPVKIDGDDSGALEERLDVFQFKRLKKIHYGHSSLIEAQESPYVLYICNQAYLKGAQENMEE